MAILKGLIRKQRGSIGDLTIRQVKGVSVTSEKAAPSNPRTFAQMRQRVQWRNIQNIWSVIAPYDHPSFENRRALQSDANLFLSANLARVPVYLTASEARGGGAVVAPYQVTRGSLPSVEVVTNGTNGEVGTDISLGSLTIDESTTLKQFSDAVVNNNTNFKNGDQITCIVLTQATNTVTGYPYVTCKAYEVTLDQTDNENLIQDDGIDPNGVAFTTMTGSDKLGMSMAVNGGVVYIHSRKTPSKTLVSTQDFVVNNTLLANYQSDAKMNEAIRSYGGKVADAYLTPNVDVAPAGN